MEEGRRKREEGRGKREEGRRKKEEGRRKKEEGRRKPFFVGWVEREQNPTTIKIVF
jgi:hypothetical protein